MANDDPRGNEPSDPGSPALHAAASRIGELEALDAPAQKLGETVRKILGPGRLKDALSGTFLGHALHPLLTDLPIGTWTSASILDLAGGEDSEKAAQRLIGAGILAAVPTAVTGYSDWADTEMASDSARRVGLVHAAANVTALSLYTASYLARRRGHHGRGVALGLVASGALGVGGHLGGHLAYVEGVGVAQTTFEEGPFEWTATLPVSELPEGETACAEAGGVAVLLARQGGRIYALSNNCTHRGGPLHEGELSDGCITCPWHESRFRLSDGSVVQGPATSPQPAFETRVSDGRIEVRQATDPTP